MSIQLKNICYYIVIESINTTNIFKNCYYKNHNVKKKFVIEMNTKIYIKYICHKTKKNLKLNDIFSYR
jgi:hypothetical protein